MIPVDPGTHEIVAGKIAHIQNCVGDDIVQVDETLAAIILTYWLRPTGNDRQND